MMIYFKKEDVWVLLMLLELILLYILTEMFCITNFGTDVTVIIYTVPLMWLLGMINDSEIKYEKD